MQIQIADDFDPAKIAQSGQCFRALQIDDHLTRFITKDQVLYVRKMDQHLYDVSCTEQEWESTWHSYFDLNRNYKKIRNSIPTTDGFLFHAATAGVGIRILRQDPWEMLISFIISQRKSIPAIQQSVESIASTFGHKLITHHEEIYTFPTSEELANATDADLRACKLGYRVPYVLDAIKVINAGLLSLDALSSLNDDELVSSLQGIKGVGKKVANCVGLFAYGRTALVPIDTWINKIINQAYKGFDPFIQYTDVAGIIQQYAFYFTLKNKELVTNGQSSSF